MIWRIVLNNRTPAAVASLYMLIAGLINLNHGVNNTMDFNHLAESFIQLPFVAIIVYFSLRITQSWRESSNEWRESAKQQNAIARDNMTKTLERLMQMQQAHNEEIVEKIEAAMEKIATADNTYKVLLDRVINTCPVITGNYTQNPGTQYNKPKSTNK